MRLLSQQDFLDVTKVKGEAYGHLKGIQRYRPEHTDKIRTMQYRAWEAYYKAMQEMALEQELLHVADVCRVAHQRIGNITNEDKEQLCLLQETNDTT